MAERIKRKPSEHRCNHVHCRPRLVPNPAHNGSMKIEVRLYQDEDGVWIAEAPSIPGCGSDGRTREEALINIKDAAEACLAVRKDLGMPATMETVTIEVAA